MSATTTARRIRIGAHDVVLEPGIPGEVFAGFPASAAFVHSTLLRHLDDGAAVAQLRHALLEIEGSAVRMDDVRILERVAMQVELGRWQLEPRIDERPPLDPPEVTDLSDLIDPEIEDPPVLPSHFVEIALVDADDAPVAGQRYQIELPNGTVMNGRTNDAGVARVDGITRAGTCKVRFPDLDEDAWEPA
jgi:hypothetical protein